MQHHSLKREFISEVSMSWMLVISSGSITEDIRMSNDTKAEVYIITFQIPFILNFHLFKKILLLELKKIWLQEFKKILLLEFYYKTDIVSCSQDSSYKMTKGNYYSIPVFPGFFIIHTRAFMSLIFESYKKSSSPERIFLLWKNYDYKWPVQFVSHLLSLRLINDSYKSWLLSRNIWSVFQGIQTFDRGVQGI